MMHGRTPNAPEAKDLASTAAGIGAPPLNAPRIYVTFFPDIAAKQLTTENLTLHEIGASILITTRRTKAKLPWLKLAVFGDRRTAKGSLRHDANVSKISGIEIDYDVEVVSFDDALAALMQIGVHALIYTSPTHNLAAPRWRIIAPTSQQLQPEERAKLVARLNGYLKAKLKVNKIASSESFALSQSFYYGWVCDSPKPHHRAVVTEGVFIDQCEALQQYEADGAKIEASTATAGPEQDTRGFDAILSTIGDGDGLDGFNRPLIRAAASYVALHQGHFFSEEKLKTLLRKAIDDAPKKPERDDIDGYRSDQYLDDAIASAVRKFVEERAITLQDFVAVMSNGAYLFAPTRELWPGKSVNACIPPIPRKNKDGSPMINKKTGEPEFQAASEWLDENRRVEQISWVPGKDETIKDRLLAEGGWIDRKGVTIFNLYRPPTIKPGNPDDVAPWLAHMRKLYDNADVTHMIKWQAQRVQQPHIKINHALVLGGLQGIGKDSILEPLRYAIGPWNFTEVSPQPLLGRFNGFLKSVVLRISEARDLGDVDRYSFYERTKLFIVAPPDTLRVDEKNLREHVIANIVGVILTSNYKTGGIFLPADDRRHYVAWSPLTKDDFTSTYFTDLWTWYANGGIENVAAYLATVDLADFNPKAVPPQTAAWRAIVDANRAPEDAELADALEDMKSPNAVTLIQVARNTKDPGLADWLNDRKNRRAIPYRFEQVGYVAVRNDAASDGLWKVNEKRQVIYAKALLSLADQLRAARKLTA
jgi:hypothetical protein